jgi:hypothetical protein
MQTILKDLTQTVNEAYDRFLTITEAEAAQMPAPGEWSKKQALGHLIDSAANNHQRWVRGQLTELLAFPGYAQEEWVNTQDYQNEPWADLVTLWKSYNLHLIHIVVVMPPEKQAHLCRVGDREPVTLKFLAQDYLRHMRLHLEQIFA